LSLPSLDYYDELYRKRKANKPVASFDPLDAQLRQERDREIREGLFLSASPDTIARVNKVSRVTGEPPVLVEDRVDAYEKSITSDRFMGVVQEHPSIAKWAVNNPRGAAAAVDDSLSLAKFGKAFKDLQEDFLKDDGWLEQSDDFITRRVRGIQAGFDRFAVATDDFFEGLTPDAQKSAAAKVSAPIRREKFKKRAELNEAIQASPIRNEVDWQSVKKNPTVGNIATFIRQQGASSIPDMILAVASLPVYTAGRSGEIGQERAKNSGRSEATMGDVAVASPAALLSGYLDKLGVERLILLGADTVAKRIVKATAVERLILPGADTVAKRIVKATAVEAGTEFAQEVIEYGGATIGTDVAFNPGEALDRGLAGAVGGAGMAAPIRTSIETPRIIKAVAPVVSKLLQSGNAKKEALFLDNVMKASEKSKLRERDPEAFKDMLRGMAEENGVANVYVSGEALQEYMQSDAYDPDGPLAAWVNQVEEAAATGGDVLMPIEEAAVALQPAWATLKDDVRLSAGGVSRREAQTFDDAMADVMDELERSMAEQEQATAKKLGPIEKLATSINQKLQNAGFTPSTAKIQADLLVQRYATRAERLGKQLTGNEFDVTVNNVLPEGLAAARNADNLDLVINSYFTMKNPKAETGKSLVEWIAERGGVTDEGGDLEDMGLGKWHREKAFRKRALRKSEKGQSSFVAADDKFSRNSVLRAAVDQGYFPELETETNLDERALLEAIDAELRGVPRYAQERIADDVRELAGQLDEFLSQAGFDPANMTPEQMRDAIEKTQEAQDGGYEQATIEIDGVERPTRNSNGQPLAQTEEGLRNFYAWFGDSKVVDAEGRPLVVYHGTRSGEIEAFDPEALGKNTGAASARLGFFFAGSEATSLSYVDRTLTESDRETADGVVFGFDRIIADLAKWADESAPDFAKALRSSNVLLWHSGDDPGVAVQANSYDPSEVDGFGGYLDDVIREIDSAAFWEAELEGDLGSYAQSQIDRLQSLKDGYDNIDLNGTADQEAGSVVLQTYLKIERLLEVDQGGQAYRETSYYDLISQGKEARSDGVVIRNTYDGGPKDDVFVAFRPEQIKSINNRGAFDPSDARILYQSAYHGSPHIFDKFSLDKIGTGEGAQAYGWGLYFAGRKEIAEHYREALTSSGSSHLRNMLEDSGVSADLADTYIRYAQGAAGKMNSFERFAAVINEKGSSDMQEEYRAGLRPQLDGLKAALQKTQGRLYKVEIPDDDEYLLWDKPLSEQPAKVKAALAKIGNSPGDYEAAIKILTDDKAKASGRNLASGWHDQEIAKREMDLARANSKTGAEYYREVGAYHSDKATYGKKTDERASLTLLKAGIAGIKYLDGGSRSDGEGSYNYVVFDDSRVSIQAYEQSYGDGPRGRISFYDGQATIDLFQSRNLSTFLHETGHLWLEELAFDASLPEAPQQLKDDWQTVQDWFSSQGHKVENGMIPTDAHEMWARGVERYLMEGKSPIGSLKRIFETFKAWLTAIYKTVDALKSPITPEVREVMDRLIATDEQIQDIAEQQKVEAVFKDAAEAGMSDAEFQAYVKQTEDARSEAKGKLIEKVMRSIRSRETKAYRDSAQNVRDEIEPEVDARPLFKALRNLKEQPIDAGWLKEEMGEDAFRLLPRRRPAVYKDGGVHPDVIAEQSGFATGKAMVEALMGAEIAHRKSKEGGDTRSMRERTIQEEVSAIMQARYGDPLNDGSIEREALEVVHNDMQGEVIASEIRVLARRSGKRPTPYAIAKDWARNKIRSGIVTQEASPSAIQRYARAAQRSATAAQEAMLKQDVDEAFRHKQAQMLNNALVSEAKKAFDDVEGAVKRLEKVAKRKTMKSVDQDYLEQAQALLEAVDIRRRSQVSIDKQGKFEAWAREREAEGFDVVVPASFGEMLGTTNWTRLTVENLLGLDDAVKQIMHLGRLKQTLLDNKEQRDFDELVKEATDGMGNLRQKPPSDMMEPTYWDGIKSKILAADAALLKMETVFDWLDNKDSDGVFNRVVFRPIADAQENERVMLEKYITKLADALKAVPRDALKRWGDKVETGLLNRETGNPYVLNREQLISIALNVGNQSNLDKLTGGYGWNEGQVLSVLAQELTEAEWNYVQSVWDTIESLWPQIEAMEKRLNGVAPEKIEPRSVETPFGVLKGGYFPVVYDPRKNYDAEANAAKGRDLFETIYTRATTPKGFTKERTNVERPIHLSLGIINRHVSEVIHDLTHREAIMQADKFLSNRRIMKGVDDTLGPEVRRQFRPWLQRIANEWAYDRAGQAGIENILKQARLNTTIVGMGFRATTILMQLAGYSNSFERVGFKWVAKRLKDVGNPAAWDFVLSKSKEVAGRMNSLDRDIRDNIKDAMGKKRWLTAPKKFAFHGIAYMDRVVVVPTWLGAYDKALAEGRTEEDAIYAADRVVRQSQGAGAAKDLAAVQSGRGTAGEAFKLLTQFYSFMSAFYQRQRTFGRDVRNAKLNDAPALLARAWWLFIVPPVLAELLAGRGPDDDEDEALWAFEKIMLQVFGPIPIVRDVAPVALAKIKDEPTFGYKFTPVSGAMQSMINVSGDVSNIVEGEETKRATRNSIETVGYFTGLTTGQMAAAAQFLVDVSYGEQSPEDFADWWEGLTTGKIKEE